MIVNSCYFLVVVFVCFPSLGFACESLPAACVFVGDVSFLRLEFFLLALSVVLDLWIGIV